MFWYPETFKRQTRSVRKFWLSRSTQKSQYLAPLQQTPNDRRQNQKTYRNEQSQNSNGYRCRVEKLAGSVNASNSSNREILTDPGKLSWDRRHWNCYSWYADDWWPSNVNWSNNFPIQLAAKQKQYARPRRRINFAETRHLSPTIRKQPGQEKCLTKKC